MPKTGGQLIAESLYRNKVKNIFCVPGESYLGALDGLFDKKKSIKVINARHEAGAANMAESYGKITGKPGVALVTRGPGACHASVGVHIAFQDSTPMILIVGDVSRNLGRVDPKLFTVIFEGSSPFSMKKRATLEARAPPSSQVEFHFFGDCFSV